MVNNIRPFDGTPTPAPAPAPAPASTEAEFSYNAQDTVVLPNASTTVSGLTGNGIATDKVNLDATLAPNKDGKYVYPDGDPQQLAAQTFSNAAKTVETFSKAFGQPVTWAFSNPTLAVEPDAGEDFNAYYNRDTQNINFFHGADPVTSQQIYSGASGEVVAHETGHAILDGLRPNYFSSWTPDVGAFHESFGDQMGILMALHDQRSIDAVVAKTGGDLTKTNPVSETGEQLGIGINDYVGQDVTGGNWVRNAINDFKWADPSTLPDGGSPTQLGSEVHSFSRLWTGAFYDVLAGINAQQIAGGMDPAESLKKTGEEGLKVLTNLMKEAPQADFTYKDMAQAFVKSDQDLNNGQYSDLISKVFTDRGILGGSAKTGASAAEANLFSSVDNLDQKTRTISFKLNGPQFGTFSGAIVSTVVDKDGSLSQDAEVGNRTKSQVAKLISQGRIKFTNPGETPSTKDLFDSQGRPYTGVVKWVDGQMHIERVKIAD